MNKKLKEFFEELTELLEMKNGCIYINDKITIKDIINNLPKKINKKILALKITKENKYIL